MATRGKVVDKDRGYAKAIKSLKKLAAGAHVVAGIRGEKGSAKHDDGTGGGDLTIVDIMAVHEFGSEKAHVPERSFIRATFDANVSTYGRLVEKSVGRVVDGEADLEGELGRLGLKVAGDIQQFVRAGEGPPPALQPETIKRKKGSTHRLIDTARGVQSIDHEVRKGPPPKG